MTPDAGGRGRLRAVGTLVGLVATVGIGAVTIVLSPAPWHTVLVAVLVMLATASAVVLVVAHLRAPGPTGATAARMLDLGFVGALVAAVGLDVTGVLGLLTDDPATAAITTWLTALVATGPVGLAVQGRREARNRTDAPSARS